MEDATGARESGWEPTPTRYRFSVGKRRAQKDDDECVTLYRVCSG